MERNNSNKKNELNGVPPSGARGLNWGTGIIIAFVLFMSFILYFIIKVQTNSKYDNELVYEEYYKHDAKFGNEMTRVQNAQNLAQKPTITNSSNGINVVFPTHFVPKNINGKIAFYRPSNKKFDFEIPILLTGSSLNIPKEKLLGGRWNINMEWQYKGKQYLTKEVVYIESVLSIKY